MHSVIQENTSELLRILHLKGSYGESVKWDEKDIRNAMAIAKKGIDISNNDVLERIFVSSFCEPLAAYLLSKGVDINMRMLQYRDHPSLLHLACAEARADAVKFLVENGADINAEDGSGMRPISFVAWAIKSADNAVARNRASELKKYLEDMGAQETVKSRQQMQSAARELAGDDKTYKAGLATGPGNNGAVVSLEAYRSSRKDSGRTP